MNRLSERGISLLNVLVVLTIGTTFSVTLLSREEDAIAHAQQAQDSARAHALAKGGVASVQTALARDFLEAPDADHLKETWVSAVQKDATFDFGSYEVTVKDARGRFDINALAEARPTTTRVFRALLQTLDLPEALLARITQIVARHGPFVTVNALLQHGLSEADLDRLSPHIVALPQRSDINLNAASLPVMTALTGDPRFARALIARRSAKGYVDADDLNALGLLRPALSGFASDAFDVSVTAKVGTARRVLSRRLIRDPETGAIRHLPLDP